MATAFTRSIKPRFATWPQMPTGVLDIGQSGRGVMRALANMGRSWTEEYGVLDTREATPRAFLALCHKYYSQRTILDVTHVALEGVLGAPSGTPLVQGAQSGASILTDGWPNSTTVLKAGDIITFANVLWVFDVTADVTSNGSGEAIIAINPPVVSVANNAAIAHNGTPGTVTFRAVVEALSSGGAEADSYLQGLALTFREIG